MNNDNDEAKENLFYNNFLNSHEIELTPETTATIDDAKKQIEKISIE